MREFTTSEVVALFDLDERRVRKDVEYGVLDVKSPPRFDLADVAYMLTMSRAHLDLGVSDRKMLYARIAQALATRRFELELGAYLIVRLESVLHDIAARVDEFDAWVKRLVQDPHILGGEPVFPNSRLAVRHVGEMARRGGSVREILEDYPTLTEKDVEFARRFVTAYPRVGRPRGQTPAR